MNITFASEYTLCSSPIQLSDEGLSFGSLSYIQEYKTWLKRERLISLRSNSFMGADMVNIMGTRFWQAHGTAMPVPLNHDELLDSIYKTHMALELDLNGSFISGNSATAIVSACDLIQDFWRDRNQALAKINDSELTYLEYTTLKAALDTTLNIQSIPVITLVMPVTLPFTGKLTLKEGDSFNYTIEHGLIVSFKLSLILLAPEA